LFFVQAEDGIRDRNVTGVQTCALPISPDGAAVRGRRAPSSTMIGRASTSGRTKRTSKSADDRSRRASNHSAAAPRTVSITVTSRSEERRVGRGGGWRRAGEEERRRRGK